MYDQVARNRMREKLTASLIFKNRKSLYALRFDPNFLSNEIVPGGRTENLCSIYVSVFRTRFWATTFVCVKMLNGKNYVLPQMTSTSFLPISSIKSHAPQER